MTAVDILKAESLKVYYRTLHGSVKAIDGVTFEVRKGEVLGIAGESGCGKSTLVNFLVLPKDPMYHAGGKVFLKGKEITSLPKHDLRKIRYEEISIIPQYSMDSLSPTRRIRMIIRDLMREHGKDFDPDLVRERLSMVNLPQSVLNMYPVELSGGMRQRATMVISTLLNPDILIADEITSALDVSTQKFVIEMLLGFMDRKVVSSIVFITHDLSILYQIATRVMVLYAGKIVEIGPMEEVIEKPVHPYTKALIYSLPKMNVRFKERRLKGIPGQPPHLLNPPSGCRFHNRCPLATKRCEEEEPPLVEVGKDHYVYCWEVKV